MILSILKGCKNKKPRNKFVSDLVRYHTLEQRLEALDAHAFYENINIPVQYCTFGRSISYIAYKPLVSGCCKSND